MTISEFRVMHSNQNQENEQRNGYGALTNLFLEPLVYFDVC